MKSLKRTNPLYPDGISPSCDSCSLKNSNQSGLETASHPWLLVRHGGGVVERVCGLGRREWEESASLQPSMTKPGAEISRSFFIVTGLSCFKMSSYNTLYSDVDLNIITFRKKM